MKVLVACEFSGVVRECFRTRGHDAWSCDLLPTEWPGQHIQDDIRNVDLSQFDLMIAHPPCRYLAQSGARWWKDHIDEQRQAGEFCRWLWQAPVQRIAIENPRGRATRYLGIPTQCIEPWHFGHPETKATNLWLKGLPLLRPTAISLILRSARVHHERPGPDRWKRRSRTLHGIAAAMAKQWGGDWTR